MLIGLQFIFIQSLACQQTQRTYISIATPSIEQEAGSIWRTINDFEFLEKQGYKINLPDNDLIDSLIVKSKKGKLGNDDFPEIFNLLESHIYKKEDYSIALRNVSAQEDFINKIVDQLYRFKSDWGWQFKTFDEYNIVFTLYGTGGSYDPDLGSVTLFTNIEGEFMQYDNPSNTIVHEIVHIGIEKAIIQKYDLPHALKERIVDKLVYILFEEFLPEYRIQNMGYTDFDEYLTKTEDIANLDSLVKQYLEKSTNIKN